MLFFGNVINSPLVPRMSFRGTLRLSTYGRMRIRQRGIYMAISTNASRSIPSGSICLIQNLVRKVGQLLMFAPDPPAAILRIQSRFVLAQY